MIEAGILSSDTRRKMNIIESGEKLVDLRTKCPGITYQIAEYLNHDGTSPNEAEDAYFVRESVAKMINNAQDNLPEGFKLLVRCGYRTPEVQARQYEKDYADLIAENPAWSKAKLDLEIVKRTDPPDIGPHCTGGAIDISIVGKDNKQLDMGSDMGKYSNRAYTNSMEITKRATLNRQILIDAMSAVGFLNFPAEWWHWSYGDREWAYANNEIAFYGSIERPVADLLDNSFFSSDKLASFQEVFG